MTTEITICTVSFGHAQYLELNYELGRRLNGETFLAIPWLVAENAPASATDRLTGAERPFVHYGGSPSALGASYQHAVALNSLVSKVSTRYLLVLDPDFYILAPGWVNHVLLHMRRQHLAFFGAPWHPRYVQNYRYFPAVHCMFVDGNEVDLHSLDFRPILDETVEAEDANPSNRVSSWLRRFKLEHRRRKAWDTGIRVFRQYGHEKGMSSECVVPVYRVHNDWLGTGDPLSWKSRILESLLPDEKCYLPKKRSSYTEKSFADRGWSVPDLPSLWEQHIWRNRPFGLHVRRSYAAGKRNAANELMLCRNVLKILGSGE